MIVIGFSRLNNFKGWLIRKITDGYWNHVWIGYFDSIWNKNMIIHSTDDGVIIQRAELIERDYDESICYEINDKKILNGLKKSGDYINKPYDFKSVILNGLLLLLFKLTKIHWFNPIINQNKLSCSEFVVFVLQNAGFKRFQDKKAELWPPDGPEGILPRLETVPKVRYISFRSWLDEEFKV